MKWASVYVFLFLVSVPHFFYRFNHPEKSETQLFLDFFKAYQEFFMSQ